MQIAEEQVKITAKIDASGKVDDVPCTHLGLAGIIGSTLCSPGPPDTCSSKCAASIQQWEDNCPAYKGTQIMKDFENLSPPAVGFFLACNQAAADAPVSDSDGPTIDCHTSSSLPDGSLICDVAQGSESHKLLWSVWADTDSQSLVLHDAVGSTRECPRGTDGAPNSSCVLKGAGGSRLPVECDRGVCRGKIDGADFSTNDIDVICAHGDCVIRKGAGAGAQLYAGRLTSLSATGATIAFPGSEPGAPRSPVQVTWPANAL